MTKRLLISLLLVLFVIGLSLSLRSSPKAHDHARYVKIDQSGVQLKPWQGPWHCVFDKQLGVLWEVKQEDESIHQSDWSYSWFDGAMGDANLGDCYFKAERCDTQDLVDATNAEQLCGLTNWRLPTHEELNSLFRPQDRAQQPKLNEDFFPRLKNGDYWSAESNVPLTGFYQRLGTGALAFNPYEFQFRPLPYRNAAFVMLIADVPNSAPNKPQIVSNTTLPSPLQLIEDDVITPTKTKEHQ